MTEQSLYWKIISRSAGAWSIPLRGMLRVGEWFYSAGVALRNRRFDRPAARTTLPIPVISVGNITVGGTGKTPMVIDLVERLDLAGRSVAVISRGYGTPSEEPNDEERLIRKRCPSAVCLSDPDRVRAGERAHLVFGADVIVLDDGFQHRRLDRALDIVLIDATCPFGHGHLLPRGLLREPPSALRRADVVVLSRCDQVSPVNLTRLDVQVRRLAREAIHLQCRHRVSAIERLDGTPWEGGLEGKRAVVFAGIARPAAFVTTMRTLGVDVVARRFWPDHHRYRLGDVAALYAPGRFPKHDFLLTTEKDAVKLAALDGLNPGNILVAKVAIEWLSDSETKIREVLEEAASVKPRPTSK